MYAYLYAGFHRGQERVLDPLKMELQALAALKRELQAVA